MAKAYLKIWVDVGKEKAVRERLREMKGVKSADLTTGEQDIIALLEADDYQSLLNAILGGVRGIEGVEKTMTNLVLE